MGADLPSANANALVGGAAIDSRKVREGELFFASDQELIDSFDYADDPSRVIIDFSHAHVWDASAVAALDAIEQHYARHGAGVEINGLNEPSAELHETLSGRTADVH